MLDTVKELLAHQYEAALCTLNHCIGRCPESAWNAPVGNLAFCQVAFHTLFFTDLYLGADEAALRRQTFHREHDDVFRDYEELEPRPQQLFYKRPWIRQYVDHCRQKALDVVAVETAESLMSGHGFERRPTTRAELHVSNIRHIQHHAAQMSLRLRIDQGIEVPWVGWGWRAAD